MEAKVPERVARTDEKGDAALYTGSLCQKRRVMSSRVKRDAKRKVRVRCFCVEEVF